MIEASPPVRHGGRLGRQRRAFALGLVTLAAAILALALALRRASGPSASGGVAATTAPDALAPAHVDLAGAPARAGGSDAAAATASDATSAASSDEVRGRVVDEGGRAIPGAKLWFVPRGAYRPLSAVSAGPVCDAEGRFVLEYVGEARGRFVRIEHVAVAGGPSYLPAFLDGDRLTPGVDVQVVLKEGRRVTVTVYDALGDPVAGADVHGMDALSEVWPSFSTRASGWIGDVSTYRETDVQGRAMLSVPTSGPVVVTSLAPPLLRGFVPSPQRVVVPPTTEAVTFRLVPAYRLRIRCLDAVTDAPFRERTNVAVDTGEGTDLVAALLDGQPDAHGLLEAADALPEGRYRITISAAGRRDATTTVEGRAGVAAVETVVRLVPEGGGAIRLLVEGPTSVADSAGLPTHTGASPPGPVLWLRRTDPTSGAWAPAPPADTTWRLSASQVSVRRMPPGMYDVYLFEPASGCALFLPSVRVREGQHTERGGALRPGARPRVSALLPGADWVSRLRVRTKDVEDLPVLVGDAATALLGADERLTTSMTGAALPFDDVEGTFTAPDGSTRTAALASE